MIVNAEVIKLVSTSLVKTLVKMLVESVLNAKLSIMVRILVQFSKVSSNFSILSFFRCDLFLSQWIRGWPTYSMPSCPKSILVFPTKTNQHQSHWIVQIQARFWLLYWFLLKNIREKIEIKFRCIENSVVKKGSDILQIAVKKEEIRSLQ